MHTALIVQNTDTREDAALNGALASCGFTVTLGERLPQPAEWNQWSLIAAIENHDAMPCCRLWLPAAMPSKSTGMPLRLPARLADVTTALLACGYAWIDRAERAALFVKLGELCEHDESIIAELVESILSTTDEDLAALRNAFAQGRSADAAETAHRIKSVSNMLALSNLSTVCAGLEQQAKSNGLDSDAAALAVLLQAGFSELSAALRGGR